MSTSSAPPASSSAPTTFKGFGPPAWIFSFNAGDPDPAPTASTSSLAGPIHYAPPPPRTSFGRPRPALEEGDTEGSYGPRTRRRGNVRFVPARGLVAEKGKGRATDEDKGAFVRGLYESIVSATPPPPPAPRARARTPDVDLTLDSDSDDEVIILNPLTRLPYPRPRPARPRAIHDLLADSTPSSPLLPPIQYALKPSNIGWRLLARQGWVEGQPLGPLDEKGEGGGLKVPLKGSEKFDRAGLGGGGRGERRESPRETEERRREEERGLREKGSAGMEKKRRKEEGERKALLAYMNR